MIAYPDALALMLAESRTLDPERVSLDMAAGRCLARGIASPLSLPSFDNAAMDGFAFRANAETVPAGTAFAVAGMHAAGDGRHAYPGAEACEIATGARMPEGFDTVVPIERCERLGDTVRLLADEPHGQNVRHRGDDIAENANALSAGRRMDPASIMLLAALGIDAVDAVRRPRIAIVCTGSELNPAGQLPPGGIHDSNGPFLAASVARWGVDLLQRTRVPDTGEAFHTAVHDAIASGADLIVTTGAVSAGRFDFVPSALASLGARLLFHKVAMRPGKPLLAARFDGGPLVLALPGNPIAVAVGYRFFVAPVLRAMAGLAPEQPTRVHLSEPHVAREGMHHFALGHLEHDTTGRAIARAIPTQAAYRILPYTQANTWLSAADAFGNMADAWPIDPVNAA